MVHHQAMRLIALALVRNEGWVLRYSGQVILRWADELVILDHCSTDETSAIISELMLEHPGRIVRFRETDPVMNWMATRQRLLTVGRKLDGTHFVLWDADEILSANLLSKAREVVASLKPGELLRMPWANLWRSLDNYRGDLSKHGARATIPVAFADHPDLHWRLKEQLHHRDPAGIRTIKRWPSKMSEGAMMHLQRANWRRAVARQDLYRAIEVTRWPDHSVSEIDRMYAASIDEKGAQMVHVPATWWNHRGLTKSLIDLESEPWEAAAFEQMVAEHGRDRFAGLSLTL